MAEGWTPGPWRAWRESRAFQGTKLLSERWGVISGRVGVAEVATKGARTSERVAADARLIAAAPEMAALLERFLPYIDNDPFYQGLDAEVRALLRSIRGTE